MSARQPFRPLPGAVASLASAFVGLLALVGPVWGSGDFLLVDPANPGYYQRVITAGEDLKVDKDTVIEGNIHSHRKIDLKKDAVVTGDASAVDEVKGSGTVNGQISEGVEPLPLPAMPLPADLRALADRVLEGKQKLEDVVIDDVLFVDGDVDIEGTLEGDGTLIVDGKLKIKKGSSSFTPSGTLSMVVFEKVDIDKERHLRAVIRALGDVKIDKDVVFEGVILADGKVDLKKDGNYTFLPLDQDPPSLDLISPIEGAVIDDPVPRIEAVWTDDRSGIDLSSVEALVDGVDRVSQAILGPDGLILLPSPFLAEGEHTVQIRVADLAGNTAQATVSFEIDTRVVTDDDFGPDLAILQPIDGSSMPVADFEIRLAYADAEPGVASNTLQVRLDGADITARCWVDPDSARCPIEGLAAGTHTVDVEIQDRGGNRSSQSSDFTVDLSSSDTTPPFVEFLAPPSGPVRDSDPELIVRFSDGGSGVDEASLAVRLDGTPLSSCTIYPGWAVCSSPILEPGSHEAEVALADRAGNTATASRTFSIDPDAPDPTPPELTMVAPNSPTIDRPDPELELVYRDDESGLDLASLEVLLDSVDITASCAVESSRASCPTAGLGVGAHRVEASLANGVGTVSRSTFDFEVELETEPPTFERIAPSALGVTTATPTLAYGYDDEISGVDSASFVLKIDGVALVGEGADGSGCDVGPVLASCQVGPLAEGPHTLEVQVADRYGNLVSLNEVLDVELEPEDSIAPQLTLLAPAEGAVIRGSAVAVQITFEDAVTGVDLTTLRIDVDGIGLDTSQCNIGAGQASCQATGLAAGQHTVGAEIRDRAGNLGSTIGAFVSVLQAEIEITSPATGFVTSEESVDIEGSFVGNLGSVTVAGRPALLAAGLFVAADVPLHEGGNTLTAVGRGVDGSIGTATVQVVRDTEAPRVVIRSPADGFVSASAQLAVTGELIHPSSSSTEGRPVRVWVNEVEAEVEAGTFLVPDLRLTPGPNQIRVEAEDAAGNRGLSTVDVRVIAPGLARLEPLVVLEETGRVGELLETPLSVRAVDGAGVPLAGRTLRFAVSRGDGEVVSFPDSGRSLELVTDGNGIAQVSFRLGRRVGRGNHEVTVTSAGLSGAVVFCASAEGDLPQRIVPVVGSRHTATLVGAAGSALPEPLLVQVFDRLGNPSPGVPVTFRIVAGGGNLTAVDGSSGGQGADGAAEGASEVTVDTDVEGRASAAWTLGAEVGIDAHIAEAIFPGLTENPAVFLATGREPGPENATAVVGLVLDNRDAPVPGASVRLLGSDGAAVSGTATSDAEGRFRLHPAPVGTVVLEVDGTTTPLAGTWPILDFEMTTVSGLDSSLGAPIRLLPLDENAAKIVGGSEDVVLSIAGVAGAELRVFAGSTTFPNGSKTGPLSLTQVHGDKVPMQAPQGSNFMLAWTVQPPGVRFDPPAQISIPNLAGAPGEVVDIFSFDHDLGEFVPVGTASVSDDGSRVVSNPGSGVVKSGWHGCVPPPPPPSDTCGPGGCFRCGPKSLGGLLTKSLVPKCGECEDCRGISCVPKEILDIIIRVDGRIDRERVAKGKAASFSAQAVANCQAFTYEWFFPNGERKTGSFVSHTFEDIGSKTVFVEAKCSQPDCASAFKTKDKEVQVFDLEITDPQDAHEWEIDAMPQMPEMSAIAQILGVSPDPSFETEFTWEFNVRSKFDQCAGGSPRSYEFESGPVQVFGSVYEPMTDRLLGGHVELEVKAELDGVQDDDELEDVKIVGTNPNQTDISAALNDDDLRRISCRESGQRQFDAATNGGTSVCPVFNRPRAGANADGGVGIMQVTFQPSEADHWNWRTNITSAIALYNTARQRAANHPGRVRRSQGFANAVNAVNAARMAQNLGPLMITVPDFTAEQLRRGGLRCYNGCPAGGQFRLPWFEYRLAFDNGLLRLANVNEANLTAEAVWEVVPVAARPNVGDRDYVNHIINSSTTCP